MIRFEYGSTLKLSIKYLFITLYRIPAKPKKRRRSKKKKATAETLTESAAEQPAQEQSEAEQSAETASAEEAAPVDSGEKKKEKKQKNPSAPTLPEIVELVKVLVDSLCKPLRKLLRRIKISEFDIKIVCGGSDAAKAALKFGAVNIAVGNFLGFLDSFFTLKDPHVKIDVDFQSEETTAECSCTVKMCAMIFLMFVFTFLGRLIARVFRSDRIKAYIGRIRSKKPKHKVN